MNRPTSVTNGPHEYEARPVGRETLSTTTTCINPYNPVHKIRCTSNQTNLWLKNRLWFKLGINICVFIFVIRFYVKKVTQQ